MATLCGSTTDVALSGLERFRELHSNDTRASATSVLSVLGLGSMGAEHDLTHEFTEQLHRELEYETPRAVPACPMHLDAA